MVRPEGRIGAKRAGYVNLDDRHVHHHPQEIKFGRIGLGRVSFLYDVAARIHIYLALVHTRDLAHHDTLGLDGPAIADHDHGRAGLVLDGSRPIHLQPGKPRDTQCPVERVLVALDGVAQPGQAIHGHETGSTVNDRAYPGDVPHRHDGLAVTGVDDVLGENLRH